MGRGEGSLRQEKKLYEEEIKENHKNNIKHLPRRKTWRGEERGCKRVKAAQKRGGAKKNLCRSGAGNQQGNLAA